MRKELCSNIKKDSSTFNLPANFRESTNSHRDIPKKFIMCPLLLQSNSNRLECTIICHENMAECAQNTSSPR